MFSTREAAGSHRTRLRRQHGGLLLVQKSALEHLEDSAPVPGKASLSVSPKHPVRLRGDEEDKDVGGFLDAEIRWRTPPIVTSHH